MFEKKKKNRFTIAYFYARTQKLKYYSAAKREALLIYEIFYCQD